VSSDRCGVWRVQAEGEPRALSEHASETDAEGAAARHAAATGAHEIVVHDRYHRVHSVPPRQPGRRRRTTGAVGESSARGPTTPA
jgi:Uncharacterized protein conserved in bacteria (DUF2188)